MAQILFPKRVQFFIISILIICTIIFIARSDIFKTQHAERTGDTGAHGEIGQIEAITKIKDVRKEGLGRENIKTEAAEKIGSQKIYVTTTNAPTTNAPATDIQMKDRIEHAAAQSCLKISSRAPVLIPAGRYMAGSRNFYPEERPQLVETVTAFDIDPVEVTNARFAEFVADTGYITRAERGLPEPRYAHLPEEMRRPGSSVFMPLIAADSVSEDRSKPHSGVSAYATIWQFMAGASWRHPYGLNTARHPHPDEPVVHIAYEDAQAYASWAGRRLPTEKEWEYAARGGLEAAPFEWGAAPPDDKAPRANIWQGMFPFHNSATDGYIGPAPVGCFAPNGYGLYDMTGNVWEWTASAYFPQKSPRGDASAARGDDPAQPGVPVHVLKGGSFLCSKNFCYRFRPAARHAQDLTLGASHIGFRTVGSRLEARPLGAFRHSE